MTVCAGEIQHIYVNSPLRKERETGSQINEHFRSLHLSLVHQTGPEPILVILLVRNTLTSDE